ncbi:hypothetical protein PTKIN_Ptkin07bG0295000 [Pterospermum kingtungense]
MNIFGVSDGSASATSLFGVYCVYVHLYRIGHENLNIKVGKLQSQEKLATELPHGEEVTDIFDNTIVKWRFYLEPKASYSGDSCDKRYYHLRFPDHYREKIMHGSLNHVFSKYRLLKIEQKLLKLHTLSIDPGAEPGLRRRGS